MDPIFLVILMAVIVFGGAIFYFVVLRAPAPEPQKKQSAFKAEAPAPAPPTKKEQKKAAKSAPEIPDTGPVTATAGGFTVNPASTFPLTVYGISDTQAQELKALLDRGYTKSLADVVGKVSKFVDDNTVGCKEVDEYLRVFTPKYSQMLSLIKNDSSSWSGATATGMDKLLSESAAKAAGRLEVQLDCNLEILFKGRPSKLAPEEELKRVYGPKVASYYLKRKPGLYNVKPDHPERKNFEQLEKIGLAATGTRVNPLLVLKTVPFSKVTEMVKDLNTSAYKTEEELMGFVSKLPDLKHRLGHQVNYRTVVEVLPLKKKSGQQNQEEDQQRIQFSHELARLLVSTYIKGGYAVSDREAFKGKNFSFVKGWEITPLKVCCPYCAKVSKKKFDKKDYPKVPLHLGCRCKVITVIS